MHTFTEITLKKSFGQINHKPKIPKTKRTDCGKFKTVLNI